MRVLFTAAEIWQTGNSRRHQTKRSNRRQHIYHSDLISSLLSSPDSWAPGVTGWQCQVHHCCVLNIAHLPGNTVHSLMLSIQDFLFLSPFPPAQLFPENYLTTWYQMLNMHKDSKCLCSFNKLWFWYAYLGCSPVLECPCTDLWVS